MPDEDIFDYMNKRFKKMFKEWSMFDEDFDDMFKDFDETFEIRSPKSRFSDKDGKSKSYSISYKYQTGMKEPEVRVSGDASEEDVDRFLSGIQKRFGNHMIGLSDRKPLTLGLSSGEDINPDFKVPMMDIVENDGNVELVLEMPGIGEKDVKVDIKGKDITVTAEQDTIKYQRKISLNFEPKKNFKILENHGIITVQLSKK